LLLSLMPASITFFTDFSQVAIKPSVIITCLLVAGMIGLVSSFVPALGASRRSIVEALKFND
jgi:ABC-type antimicrobial peptide transport system permease subunit